MTATEFVAMVARLKMDGECAECLEGTGDCEDHATVDLTNDDAVDTLHTLIERARTITRMARTRTSLENDRKRGLS